MKRVWVRWCDKSAVAAWVALATLLRRLQRRLRGSGAPPGAAVVAVKLVGMGDAVLMLPALAALRARGQRLIIVTTRRCAPVFTAPGVADAVVVCGQGGYGRSLRAVWGALHAAGTVVDFEQHVFWSAALALLAPARSRRLGFRTASRCRNRAYDTLATPNPGGTIRHMKDIFDDLARAAGGAPAPELLPLPVAPEARRQAEDWMRVQGLVAGGFVVLAPGSGPSASFRRVPAAVWAGAAAGLPEELEVVLIGTRAEHEVLEPIQAASARRLRLVQDWSLQPLAALLQSAACVLAIDSGPLHLAAAMGVPVLGIFGPDAPARYSPRHAAGRSLWQGLPCSPCNNCWIYREARCTNPERFACVRTITAEQILAAAPLGMRMRRG